MIVVDSSVLAAFIRKEPGWERLVDYVKNSVSMDLAVKEVSNAIWKDYAVRKLIDYETALALFKIMSQLVGVNVVLEPEEKYIEEAFKIALKTDITVYDALYIALAKSKNLSLLTLDVKQRKTAEATGVKTVSI